MSNFYRIIEAKKVIEFTIYKIFNKFIENFQKIIKDRGLDLNVLDLESNNPNNYIISASDEKESKVQFDKVLKKLYQDGTLEKVSKTYLGGSYLPDQSQLQIRNIKREWDRNR